MNLVKLVLDLIYPPRCPFCGRVLEVWEEEGLCHQCQKTLPWQLDGGKQVDFCARCFSPLWYRGSVRRGMRRFKFQGGQIHARLFGMLMAQCLHDQWGEEVDGITWVPVSRRRLGQRGFDQCQLLARDGYYNYLDIFYRVPVFVLGLVVEFFAVRFFGKAVAKVGFD